MSEKRSKVAIFHGAGRPFTVDELVVPDLEAGELLVRNEYTTLCRSDINTWSGKRVEPTPTILGHEIVGRLVQFGPEAPRFDVRGMSINEGDRLTWAIYAADPDSECARRGIPQKGPDLFKYGHEPVTEASAHHGGLADYIILRKHTPLAKVDERVPVEVVSLINCSVSTSAGALRLAGDLRGERVLITGAGMLGVIACAMARVRGAGEILVSDVSEERLAVAKRFGADGLLTADELAREAQASALGPVGVAMDFSGQPSAMEHGLALVRTGGTAVWIGATFPQPDLAINAERIVRKILTIKGLHNYNQEDFINAVTFMEAQHDQFPFRDLICGGYSLEQVELAFLHANTSAAHRVGVDLGGSHE